MSRAIWTRPAQDDLAGIDDNAGINWEFADRAGQSALAPGRILAERPAAGMQAADGHRRWRANRTPCLLLDRIMAEGVETLRVTHDRQDRSSI